MEEGHILDNLITHTLTNNRLRSRAPLWKRMHSLASDINETTSPKSWPTATWRGRWQNSNFQLCQYIPEPSAKPPGHDLKRHQWVLLNRVLFWTCLICQLHAPNRTKQQPDLYMWWNSDSSAFIDLLNDRYPRWYQNCWSSLPNVAYW